MDVNESIIEVEEIQNITISSETTYVGQKIEWFEIPAILADFTAIFLNCIIIFIILTNKILHTRTNFTILQWAICYTFCILLGIPSMYLFKKLLEYFTQEMVCFYIDFLFVLSIGCFMFLLSLLLDWWLLTSVSYSKIFKNSSFKFTLGLFPWLLLLVCTVASYRISMSKRNLPLIFFTCIMTYSLVFCITIATNFVNIFRSYPNNWNKRGKSPQASLSLYIVSVVVIAWLPQWIMIYSDVVFKKKVEIKAQMLICTIGYMSSVMVTVILYRMDEKFRICFRRLFKCENEVEDLEAQQMKSSSSVS